MTWDKSLGIANQMRTRRLELLLTQAELAEKVGLSQATVAQVERGEKSPSVDSLLRILAGLELKFQISQK